MKIHPFSTILLLLLSLTEEAWSNDSVSVQEFKQVEKVRPIVIKVDSQIVVDNKNDNELLSIIAIIASFAAVGIAFWQTKISQDTSKHQLRAYLGVRIYNDPEVDENALATFSITNFGQTPAYDVQFYLITGVDEYPEAKRPFNKSPMNENKSIINPSVFISFRSYNPSVIHVMDEIEEGTKAIYFWGEIRYFDIYKRLQTVRYRFVRQPGGIIVNHAFGNEAT